MPHRVAPAVFLALLAALLLLSSPIGSHAATVVTVESFAFTPRDVVVASGDTITWSLIDGTFHTTTSGLDNSDPMAGSLWNEVLGAGSNTFSYVFTAPGLYPYFCQFHEALGMKGSVKVVPRHFIRVEAAPATSLTTWGSVKSLYR